MKITLKLLVLSLYLLSNPNTIAQTHNDHNNYAKLQAFEFIQNKGQWIDADLFRASSFGSTVQVRKNGLLFSISNQEQLAAGLQLANDVEEQKSKNKATQSKIVEVQNHAWFMEFLGMNYDAQVVPNFQSQKHLNYFIGNDKSKWAKDVNTFSEINYINIYANIDARFYKNSNQELEYDIIAKPGANINNIKIKYDGFSNFNINENGKLVATTSLGIIDFPAPISYQTINGKRFEIKSKYVLENNEVLGFEVGSYNKNFPLTIDPVALRWAIYISNQSSFGTNGHNHGIDVDAGGFIYVAGRTDDTQFPTTTGAYTTTYNGFQGTRGFVCKIDPGNSINAIGSMVWCTYIGGGAIGGSGSENIYALKLDAANNIYITGVSSNFDYPTTAGAVQPNYGGNYDAVVTKINNNGNTLLFSTFYGGPNENDGFNFVYVDNTSTVYLAGYSYDASFPVTNNAHQQTFASASGSKDGVFTVLDSSGNTALYSTFYGGAADDEFTCIRPSGTNDIVLSGTTNSNSGIATPGSYNSTVQTGANSSSGMIVKFDKNSFQLNWATYINPIDSSHAVVILSQQVASNGDIYFGGITNGIDPASISANAYQTNFAGNVDVYIGKLRNDGSTILAGTYVGGASSESPLMGLNIDAFGNVYGLAYTTSDSTTLHTTTDALQKNKAGSSDAIFFKLNDNLTTMKYLSYWGGLGNDRDPVGYDGIKFSDCKAYTALTTESNDAPMTMNAYNATRTNTGVAVPAIAVWNNPPDVNSAAITGTETLCAASSPTLPIIGSAATYILSDINRDGTISPQAAVGAVLYQWQSSTNNIAFTDIAGATNQNLSIAEMGILNTTTYYRRNIGLEVCNTATIVVKTVINVSTPTITGANNLCRTYNLTLTTPANANATFNWTGPNNFVSNANNIVINNIDVVNDGIYNLTQTINNCTSAAATITVTVLNCTPVANDDIFVINTIPTFTNNVIVNDADPSNDPLSYSIVNTGTAAINGTLQLNVNGTFIYTPFSNFNDTVSFTYMVCDNGNPSPVLCDTATVSLILLLDTLPIASNDVRTYIPQIPITIDVLLNDVFGDTLVASTVNIHPPANATNIITDANGDTISVTIPNQGTWSVDVITGTITFTPLTTFNGNPTPILYNAQNNEGNTSNYATVTVTTNAPPVATPDHYISTINTNITANVMVNDFDVNIGQSITLSVALTTNASNGTVIITSNGTFTYIPNNGFSGNDSFIYTICDNGNPILCDTAIVFITINAAPIANTDHDTTNFNTTLNATTLLANDSDIVGQTITINTTPISNVTNGTLVINANGTYTYTPNTGYSGIDSFIYSICDNGTPVLCDTAIVFIFINPPNTPPIVRNEYHITPYNTGITGNVLTNDSDAETTVVFSGILVAPNNGNITFDFITGAYIYTPNTNFVGNDYAVVLVCDQGLPLPVICINDTIFITVLPPPNTDLPSIKITKKVNEIMPNVNSNASFDVHYNITVKNTDSTNTFTLNNVQVIDDLKITFAAADTFTVTSAPTATGTLSANQNYNGKSDINLLQATNSTLLPQATQTIDFSVNVTSVSNKIYTNLGTVSASYNSVQITDTSSATVVSPFIDIKIPQGISPNNDDVNDFFVIRGLENYPNNKLLIFNRWGSKVFEKDGYLNNWDGENTNSFSAGKGKLPEATYFYILELNDANNRKYQGYVYLKR